MQHREMFILRTQTRSRNSGQPYATYRLVQSGRLGGKVVQSTLLNLGSHFNLPQPEWPAFAQRINELLHGHQPLLDASLSDAGQALTQRYAAQLIAQRPSAASIKAAALVPGASSPDDAARYQVAISIRWSWCASAV